MSDLVPSKLPALLGDERFSHGAMTVLDFWRWALGDLRMNNARGYLAEYLVARAVGSPDSTRIEWGAHDVTAPSGLRIEVKSSAYLQSWRQKKLSSPRFGLTGAALIWDESLGDYRDDPTGRVDAWVFALQRCKDLDTYDPLDVSQWLFWTAANEDVESWGQKTISVARIEAMLGTPLVWAELDEELGRIRVPPRGQPSPR